MIAFVEGIVAAQRDSSVVISVGGVGLEVFAPRSTLERCTPGQVVKLETYLLVREDALALYGFADTDSLEIFKLLLVVSGVGPRLALAALSQLTPSLIARAILEEDVGTLSGVSGIGKKTAERIALDLRNRVPEHLKVGPTKSGKKSGENPAFRDAVEALVALGYREAQVRTAILGLLEKDPDATAENLIRQSLSKLR
jgi:holliday junction DNA helicase RuvA